MTSPYTRHHIKIVGQNFPFILIVNSRKLDLYHLGEDMKLWTKSYLEFRSAYVSIGSGNSQMKAIKHGVPQGSVLGPLLYILYVNDFPIVINGDLCMNPAHHDSSTLFGKHCDECGMLPLYADDAVFITVSKSRMENQWGIEQMFLRIKSYLQMNGLQINEGKTMLT